MIKFKRYTDTDELMELFKAYFTHHSVQNLLRLYNGIVWYDFQNYKTLLEFVNTLVPANPFESITLTSNTRRTYQVGPNGYVLLPLIEDFLRYKNHFQHELDNLFIDENIGDVPRSRYYYENQFGEKSFLSKNLYDHYDTLKTLTQDKYIKGYAHALNQIQPVGNYLVNLDVPCFVKKTDTFVNDQMINWKSGVNFWTCRSGFKHFLPIFYTGHDYYTNLLNFNKIKIKFDDKFEIKSDFFKCSCGKFRCEFDFTPHANDFFPNKKYQELLGLADHLKTEYRLIQFIGHPNTTQVFYKSRHGDIHPDDIKLFKDEFGHITLMDDQYFFVGHKFPAFWYIDKPL